MSVKWIFFTTWFPFARGWIIKRKHFNTFFNRHDDTLYTVYKLYTREYFFFAHDISPVLLIFLLFSVLILLFIKVLSETNVIHADCLIKRWKNYFRIVPFVWSDDIWICRHAIDIIQQLYCSKRLNAAHVSLVVMFKYVVVICISK